MHDSVHSRRALSLEDSYSIRLLTDFPTWTLPAWSEPRMDRKQLSWTRFPLFAVAAEFAAS